jgi:glutathione S-transferase
MLKLYSDRFWISPWVFSCYVTLKEKGVPFEIVDLALDKKETHGAGYTQATITAKVPALDDGGFVLAESSAIIEYLEEKFPSPRVLPADAKERARARQVMSFLRTDVYALREERSTATMFYEHARKDLSDQAHADADKLFQVARSVHFSSWNIAETELVFCLQRLGLNGYDLGSLAERVHKEWSRPSVQEYVHHVRAAYVPY